MKQRLIVVSNRLPFTLQRGVVGDWIVKPASGGLVTAMEPVLREHGGVWVGWPGTTDPIPHLGGVLAKALKGGGYQVEPVMLSEEERDQFYYGYSNEVIWPLFHDLQSHCNFDPAYWQSYQAVNEKFAQAVMKRCRPEDFIWVHDYQLMHVAWVMRQRGFRRKLAFFLHIPFPPLDIFLKLPGQLRLLESLLQFDLIGFQTQRDQRNFIDCVRHLADEISLRRREPGWLLCWGKREIRTGSFPIGIDFEAFRTQAATEEVGRRAWNIHAGFPDRQLILGVDRLDYTKGIPDRLKALRNALVRYPELCQKITLIQVVVPSRTDIPKYHALKTEIDRLVGEINGQFSAGNWVPIHYIFRSLEQQELLAYYRTAEIGLITPSKDGMNLVAKEYCACSLEENCVLILSQFAGAADQLRRGALMINPYDVEQCADAIYRAFKMGVEERKARMQKMRRNIQKENIFWWVNSFVQAAGVASSRAKAS